MKDLVKQEEKAEQFDIASAATSTEELATACTGELGQSWAVWEFPVQERRLVR